MKTILRLLILILLTIAFSAEARRVYFDSLRTLTGDTTQLLVDIPASTAMMTVEARAAFDKVRERDGLSDATWGITIATDSGAAYTVALTPGNSGFGSAFDEPFMQVSVSRNDTLVLSKRFTRGFSFVKGGFNTLTAEIDLITRQMNIFAGSRELEPIGSVPIEEIPSPGIFSSVSVTVSTMMVETVADPVSNAMTPWTLDEIDTHLSASTDPVEGYWEYLDRENDPGYAIPGGRYTLAIVAADDIPGAYDILYVSGAQKMAGLWSPGMLKGRLLPTQFIDHYDLLWTDATFAPITRDIHASITQKTILTLNFPLYKTVLRFSRK